MLVAEMNMISTVVDRTSGEQCFQLTEPHQTHIYLIGVLACRKHQQQKCIKKLI